MPETNSESPKRVFTVEMGLYGLISLLALALRLIDLGRWPLADVEAGMALSAWRFARALPSSLRGFSPLLFNWSALMSFLSGGTDGLVRGLSLLAGSALVWWPFGLRRYLGRVGALATALLLAFSPSLVFFSRLADGTILVAFCGLGLVWASLSYWESKERRYLVWASALLAAALLSSPLVYSLLLVLLALPAALWLHSRLAHEEEPWMTWLDSCRAALADRAVWLPIFVAVGLVLLVGGLALTLNPLGLQQALDLFGRWVGGFEWLRGTWYRLPLLLVAYEALALVLGLAGLITERRRRDPTSFLLRAWLWIALLVSILPGYRPPSAVVLVLVPLCLLGGQAVERLWDALGEWRTHPLLWALVGVGCLMAFACLIQLVTYLTNPATQYLLRIAALAVFLLSLHALAWSLRGVEIPVWAMAVLALVLLAVGGLRTMARVNYLTARDPLEPLVGSTVSPEVLDLARYAATFSSETKGDPRVMSWQVDESLEVPLGWYLRQFENVTLVRRLPDAPTADGLILPVGAGEPARYVGLRFAVHCYYPGGTFNLNEWVRWWAGLKSAVSMITNEDAVLWVRAPQQ